MVNDQHMMLNPKTLKEYDVLDKNKKKLVKVTLDPFPNKMEDLKKRKHTFAWNNIDNKDIDLSFGLHRLTRKWK